MATTTAGILELLRTRIEALTPTDQVSADDVFRVTIGDDETIRSNRQVMLSADGGILRPDAPRRSCDEWQATVTVAVVSPAVPESEGGQDRGSYIRVLEDVDDILADLYEWSTTTAGIHRIDPSPAVVQSDGAGLIVGERQIEIQYERSTS